MIEITLEKAVEFLLGRQSPDGHWSDYCLSDYCLEPGHSDAWITAYVGHCLTSVRAFHLAQRCASPLAAAAKWLRSSARDNGGWGYNGSCRTDSDSTAYAVSFLQKMECHVSGASYSRILSLQQPDGGFATFDSEYPGDAWGISHPDVSPVAARALHPQLGLAHASIRQWYKYALRRQHADGLWRSFWWESSLYSTYINIAALEALGLPYPRSSLQQTLSTILDPNDAFQAALLGNVLALIAPQNIRQFGLTQVLNESQNNDGSWNPSGRMRVTNRNCHEPWQQQDDAGQLTIDNNGILTTATVIQYLAGQRCSMN